MVGEAQKMILLTQCLPSARLAIMKDPNAVALGRKGGKARAKSRSAAELSAIGKKGAKARNQKLTAAERKEVALMAAKARWERRGKTE
jgi:hypothetical protein